MSRPTEKMRDDDGIDRFAVYFFDYRPDELKPNRDLTDEQLFAYMCEDILKQQGIILTQERFDRLVKEQIQAQNELASPLIKPPMNGDVRVRSQYTDPEGNTYLGYRIEMSTQLQEEVYNRGMALRKEQLNSPEMEAHRAKKLEAYKEADELLTKLEKVAEYSKDHDLHGLTKIFDKQMRESGSRADSLREFLNAQPPPTLAAIEKRVEEGYEFLNIKGAREKNPEQIVAVFENLDKGFKEVGEKMKTFVSYLPGGGSALAKGIDLGLEGRDIWNEVQSGKSTFGQAIDKRIDKIVVDLVANKIGKAFGGSEVSDNVGVQRMREFTSGVASDYLKKATELYRKGAGADEYKTALADTLINNFVKTTGGSIKSLAGDDEALKKVMDAATKLGLEEPVKKLLEKAKETETKSVSTVSQLSPRSESSSSENVALAGLSKTNNAVPLPLTDKMAEMIGKSGVFDRPLNIDGRPVTIITDRPSSDGPYQSPPSNNLSAALALAATNQGLGTIDSVMLNKDGTRLIAVQGNAQSEFCKTASVVIQDAIKQPADQSLAQIAHMQSDKSADMARQQAETNTIKSPQHETEGRNAPKIA